MDLDYEEIGRNIKLCRHLRQMKQAELADRAHVTSQHISHVECGSSKISLPLLVHLSEILNVSLYELLGNNVVRAGDSTLDREMSRLLAVCTSDQKRLCVALFHAVIEQGGNNRAQ